MQTACCAGISEELLQACSRSFREEMTSWQSGNRVCRERVKKRVKGKEKH